MPVVRSAAAAFALAAGLLAPCLAVAAPTLTIGQAARHDESRPLRDILAELPTSIEDGSGAGP